MADKKQPEPIKDKQTVTAADVGRFDELLAEPVVDALDAQQKAELDTFDEEVLAVPTDFVLKGGFFGKGEKICTDPGKVKAFLEGAVTRAGYLRRGEAEHDPEFLQVIPYCVLRRGKEVFVYQRGKAGGEDRLHEKWSVGVGGHVNPGDGHGPLCLEKALARELAEEVSFNLDVAPKPAALLYDPADEVGEVHLGVVCFVEAGFQARLTFHDPALEEGHFRHPLDLKAQPELFESWSQLVVKELL
jgi:predicted NUDIX family phosphoesterase